MAKVVTISASFGAGGSLVGPAVAERLGIPFVDRAIPAAVADSLAVPLDRALAHDQVLPPAIVRILSKMASAVIPLGVAPMSPPEGTDQEDVFRSGTERVLRDIADRTGGVLLGRAAAIVLANRPGALHVRLDGPKPARLERAKARDNRPAEEVQRLLEETDRARISYVKHFYNCEPHDSRLYHLVLDSTAFPLDVCVDLIVTAANARA
jgi:cytidylate kinase-like protein